MTMLARLENTSMVYRLGDWLLFVRGFGWIQSTKLKIGDEVSGHTDPPSYHRVMELVPEANEQGRTIWERLNDA